MTIILEIPKREHKRKKIKPIKLKVEKGNLVLLDYFYFRKNGGYGYTTRFGVIEGLIELNGGFYKGNLRKALLLNPVWRIHKRCSLDGSFASPYIERVISRSWSISHSQEKQGRSYLLTHIGEKIFTGNAKEIADKLGNK
jgi:hypothetical protein